MSDYFASIVTDPNFKRDQVIQAAQQTPNHLFSDVIYIKEWLLAKGNKTAPGNDNIPYWVFHDCSSKLAGVIAGIVDVCRPKESYWQLGKQLL